MSKTKTLAEIADIFMGQSPPGSTYNESGEGLPFFQGVADFNRRYPSVRVYCSKPTRMAGPRDILISVRAPIGRINIARFDCAIGRGLSIIRAKSIEDAQYIEYALRSMKYYWEMIEGGGSVFGNATRNDLASLEIPWPSDQLERQNIGNMLGVLDDMVDLNNRMNQTLEAIAKAIFKSWFIDFDPVHAKAEGRKPYGMDDEAAALFPDSFVDSELGEIPKGWGVGIIEDEFNIIMGQSPPGDSYNDLGNGIEFYQGRTDFGFRYPIPRIYCNNPKRFADRGDTLLSVRAPVGDINMAVNRCCIGRGLASICHILKLRSYTYYAIESIRKKLMIFESEGTVFGCIGKKDLRGIHILTPPERILIDYDRLVNPLDELIYNNTKENYILQELRDSLLPKLISGEIRVNDFDINGGDKEYAN